MTWVSSTYGATFQNSSDRLFNMPGACGWLVASLDGKRRRIDRGHIDYFVMSNVLREHQGASTR